MPIHAERRVLKYSQQQIYDLVAEIEHYPEFLPWCLGARVRSREGNVVHCDMLIGFRMFRERFTSRVVLTPHSRIDVSYVDGPLKHLKNHWEFVALLDGTCEIDFYVDFEFRSRLLSCMIGALFHEAVRRMVSAFEARAADVYATPSHGVAAAAT